MSKKVKGSHIAGMEIRKKTNFFSEASSLESETFHNACT